MKTRIHTILTPAFLGVAFAVAGCATTAPSQQLTEARSAYQHAAGGPAATEVPAKVHDAGIALHHAEEAHKRDPRGQREQDLAYIAERKAMLAQQAAEERIARRKTEKGESQVTDVLRDQRDSARQEADQMSSSLSAAQQAHAEAEAKAAAALESLEKIAAIKADEQRMVITLSGSVLFETDKAVLLPIARTHLDTVAEALRAQDEEKKITIMGFTDSRGSDSYNEQLSQDRAKSVMDYLATRGIGSERMEALGKGESEPVASNDSPEGRANNRRVEIVVESPDSASAGLTRPEDQQRTAQR